MSKQEQDRMARAGQLSAAANREFLSQNRELLVFFNREELSRAMLAVIRLDFAEAIRDEEPSTAFYLKIKELAFLAVFDRGAITNVVELTPLAWDCVERMRRDNGQGVSETAPVPEPVLSPAQKIELQVRDDWTKLPTKQIRQKMANDKNYRDTVERISGELDSNVTTYTAIGGA